MITANIGTDHTRSEKDGAVVDEYKTRLSIEISSPFDDDSSQFLYVPSDGRFGWADIANSRSEYYMRNDVYIIGAKAYADYLKAILTAMNDTSVTDTAAGILSADFPYGHAPEMCDKLNSFL